MVIAVQLLLFFLFCGYNNISEALSACTRGTHVDVGVKIYMKCRLGTLKEWNCHMGLCVSGAGKCLISTFLYVTVLNFLLQLLAVFWNVSFVFQSYGFIHACCLQKVELKSFNVR